MQQSQSAVASSSKGQSESYLHYVNRDLHIIVDLVVPDTRDGLINQLSARQVRLKEHPLEYVLTHKLRRSSIVGEQNEF